MKPSSKVGIALAVLAAIGGGIAWMVWDCHHKYSRPFTWKKGKLKINYVVCLECGKEFLYDLDTLTVGAQTRVDNHDIVGNKEVH
jgi:hypothetical protein